MNYRNTISILITTTLILLLAGCAGTNFTLPEGKLELGKTTKIEAIQIMGKPIQTGEVLQNEKQIEQLKYAYASTGGEAAYSGVIPAKAFVLSFFENTLVGEEFTSSFKADNSDFNSDLVAKIEKGKTTRSEVIALLGKPTGAVIYPLIKSPHEKGIVYTYSQAKGSVFNMQFHNKLLTVVFDKADIVTDVQYTANGQK